MSPAYDPSSGERIIRGKDGVTHSIPHVCQGSTEDKKGSTSSPSCNDAQDVDNVKVNGQAVLMESRLLEIVAGLEMLPKLCVVACPPLEPPKPIFDNFLKPESLGFMEFLCDALTDEDCGNSCLRDTVDELLYNIQEPLREGRFSLNVSNYSYSVTMFHT